MRRQDVKIIMAEKSYRVHRLFQNFGFLTLGKTLGDVFNFLLFVVLSRSFGHEGIGQYSFATGFTGCFTVLAAFGFYDLSIKELSRSSGSLGVSYSPVIMLRLVLSVAVFGILLLILPFIPFSYDTKLIVSLIGANQLILLLAEAPLAAFIAREDTHIAGMIDMSLKAAATLAVCIVALAKGSLVAAITVLPVATAGPGLIAYIVMARKYGRPQLALSLSRLGQTLRQALPYGLSDILMQISTRMDVVLVGFFLGTTAAGIYHVAYRFIFLLRPIPQLAAVSLFPLASRLHQHATQDLESLYHKSINLVILVALPGAAGLWLIAPDLIQLIFGEQFIESTPILRLLAWSFLCIFLSQFLGVFLMSCDRQGARAQGYWLGACISVFGNLTLIPLLGLKGAAVTVLISETLLMVFLAVQLRAILGWPRVRSKLIISSVGVAVFSLPFVFFLPLPLQVVIPASSLLYLTTLVVFKRTRRNEVRLLVNLLKQALQHFGPNRL
jgi:O-antigen/teichoic acid export membrane protein